MSELLLLIHVKKTCLDYSIKIEMFMLWILEKLDKKWWSVSWLLHQMNGYCAKVFIGNPGNKKENKTTRENLTMKIPWKPFKIPWIHHEYIHKTVMGFSVQ